MALDKVPVSPQLDRCKTGLEADASQPTSQEAEELHGLMLKVGDDTQLDTYKGEKVVPMADTEVSVSRQALHGPELTIGRPIRSKASSSCSLKTEICTARCSEVS